MANVQVILETIDRGSKNAVNAAGRIGSAWKELATPLNQTFELFDRIQDGAAAAMEAIGRGAEMSRARSQLENLAESIGTTADALTNELGQATQGMMSNAQMVESAGQIISLGLADSKEGVVDLATVVSELGWDMQQVIMTFANDSKMRLDALGLSVEDVDKKTEAFIEQGYNMDKAFDLAVLAAGKEKIDLLGSAAETAEGKVRMITSAIEDVQDSLLIGLAEGFADGLDVGGFSEGMQEAAAAAEELGSALGSAASEAMPLLVRGAEELSNLLRGAADYMQDQDALQFLVDEGEITEAQRRIMMLRQNLGSSVFGNAEDAQADIDSWVAYAEKLMTERQEALAQSAADAMALAIKVGLDESDDYWMRWKAGQEPQAAEAGQSVGAEFWEGVTKSREGMYGTSDAENAMFIDDAERQRLEDNYTSVGESAGAMYGTSLTENILASKELAEAINQETIDAIRDAWARSGDFFTQAVGTDFYGTLEDIEDFDLGKTFYDMADGAGASAVALAGIKVAFGELTEAEAEAVYQQALFLEGIERIAEQVAGGLIDPQAGAQAAKDLWEGLQSGINEFPELDLSPKVKIEPDYDPISYGSFGGGGGGGFDPISYIMGEGGEPPDIPIGADITPASDNISILVSDHLDPLIADYSDVEIFVHTLGVETAIGELIAVKNAVEAIPSSKSISISVSGGGDIQSTADSAINEAVQSVGGSGNPVTY